MRKLNTLNLRLFHTPLNSRNHFSTVLIKTNWYTTSCKYYYCSGLKKVIVSDIAAWCDIKFGNSSANPLYYAKHLYSDENTEIKNLLIPNSVTYIGDFAFAGYSSLSSVTIPSSVTFIGDATFLCCAGLTSVIIPNGVTSIGEAAFAECSGLISVTIPNSVTSIDDYAFSGCTGLTLVTIPNSLTRINSGVFLSCSSLTSVIIPNSVKTIGDWAFNNCSDLTSVTIGKSVTSIGINAFDKTNITTINSLIENPFSICGKLSSYRTFTLNTFDNATLYIPVGTIEKYKATEGWKDFLHIEEGNPTGIKAVENFPNNNTTIYNLNGVRQSELQKGINIIKGKKVVMK